ncbi:MAG: DUF1080 domain-containing protein [Pirellulaceae bacterium]
MRHLMILLMAACFFVPNLQAEEAQPLFDGKSFEGWEGNLDWFRIESGAVVAGSLEKRIPNNEFLCTKQEFGDFELTLEAKLVGEGNNAGVQFRSKRIPNHHEVIGYQADMGRSATRTIWGNLYDESRRRKFLAEGEAAAVDGVLHSSEWVPLKIKAEGPRIQIWIGEVQTVDYTEQDDEIARSGIIGLQIHSGAPAEASYRNITLKRL